jgi:hypothetical protein
LQSYEEMFPRKKANSTVQKKIKWGKQLIVNTLKLTQKKQ